MFSDGGHQIPLGIRLSAFAVAVAVVSLLAGAATAKQPPCTHGESSEAVSFIDGHMVIIQPATFTGCTP